MLSMKSFCYFDDKEIRIHPIWYVSIGRTYSLKIDVGVSFIPSVFIPKSSASAISSDCVLTVGDATGISTVVCLVVFSF